MLKKMADSMIAILMFAWLGAVIGVMLISLANIWPVVVLAVAIMVVLATVNIVAAVVHRIF
jgi:hypothetical protein